MKTLKSIFLVILCLICFFPANAQLSDAEQNVMKRRAVEEVGQLCDYISFIANKKKALKTRLYYANKATKLFVANGEALYSDDGEKLRDPAFMQTTSINRPTPKSTEVKKYLKNLAENKNYVDIQITSTDISQMKVSELQSIGDGKYVCTVSFWQYFIGKGGEGAIRYKDKTKKKVICYIQKQVVEGGTEFLVELGDVYATETERF